MAALAPSVRGDDEFNEDSLFQSLQWEEGITTDPLKIFRLFCNLHSSLACMSINFLRSPKSYPPF